MRKTASTTTPVKLPEDAPRVAIYARYSSEMQNEKSIEEQVTLCRGEAAWRGMRVVKVYKDSAQSGWSLDREGFQRMKAAAARGRFDACLFWKFDRLARNHDHVVMIKALLRHEYGLKLVRWKNYIHTHKSMNASELAVIIAP